MSPETRDAEFINKLAGIMNESMVIADKSRDRLEEAEAELYRLRSQVVICEERVTILRERYERDRGLLMIGFENIKDELKKSPVTSSPGES